MSSLFGNIILLRDNFGGGHHDRHGRGHGRVHHHHHHDHDHGGGCHRRLKRHHRGGCR